MGGDQAAQRTAESAQGGRPFAVGNFRRTAEVGHNLYGSVKSLSNPSRRRRRWAKAIRQPIGDFAKRCFKFLRLHPLRENVDEGSEHLLEAFLEKTFTARSEAEGLVRPARARPQTGSHCEAGFLQGDELGANGVVGQSQRPGKVSHRALPAPQQGHKPPLSGPKNTGLDLLQHGPTTGEPRE